MLRCSVQGQAMHGPLPSPEQPTSAHREIHHFEFIALMAALMALQALAIDAMLPALGDIASALGVSDPNRRQLVVGIFLVCSGLGSLFPGSLADRYGRRPVLLVCLGGYVALSLACAVVMQFDALLGLRAVQALASAGLSVLPSAIIRDRFGGDRMARMLSTVSIVFMLVPMIAPTMGQAVLLVAGWRWIFVVLGALASLVGLWVWLRLPETLHPDYRQPIEVGPILRNMGASLRDRGSIGYVFGSALVMGAMFGYINSAQQLVGEHFGAGPRFPLLFGATALMLAIANLVNSRIVERFGARRVSHTAVLIYIVVAGFQVLLSHLPGQTLYSFMPMMAMNIALLGFIGANFGSIALQPFARIAGAAASVQAFVRMVIGAGLGIVIGQAYDDSARPLSWALLLCGLTCLALVLFSERGRLFRRLTPPGGSRPVAQP